MPIRKDGAAAPTAAGVPAAPAVGGARTFEEMEALALAAAAPHPGPLPRGEREGETTSPATSERRSREERSDEA